MKLHTDIEKEWKNLEFLACCHKSKWGHKWQKSINVGFWHLRHLLYEVDKQVFFFKTNFFTGCTNLHLISKILLDSSKFPTPFTFILPELIFVDVIHIITYDNNNILLTFASSNSTKLKIVSIVCFFDLLIIITISVFEKLFYSFFLKYFPLW